MRKISSKRSTWCFDEESGKYEQFESRKSRQTEQTVFDEKSAKLKRFKNQSQADCPEEVRTAKHPTQSPSETPEAFKEVTEEIQAEHPT